MKFILSSIFVIFLSYSSFTQSVNISGDEYSVFMVILGADAKGFVVEDTVGWKKSSGGEDFEFVKKQFPELLPETYKDFIQKNNGVTKLEYKFPTKNKYTLVNRDDLKQFFGLGRLNWKGFYKKYPGSGGIHNFDRVGFSKDRKQAFLSASYSCGGLCGEGKYYLLSLQKGEWVIVGEYMTWIS